MKLIRNVYVWGPLFIWMIIIFSFSSRQRITVSEEYTLNFLFFKTLHIIEYAILFLFSFRAIKYGQTLENKSASRVAFFIVLLYAISDEIHQTFVPSREGTVRDVIIDCIGASLIWLYFKYIEPKTPKKLKILVKKWQLY